jgi:hypothetical protein
MRRLRRVSDAGGGGSSESAANVIASGAAANVFVGQAHVKGVAELAAWLAAALEDF